MILITRSIGEVKKINFKTSTVQAISCCLGVRIGVNQACIGTLTPTHDALCWQRESMVVYWGIYLVDSVGVSSICDLSFGVFLESPHLQVKVTHMVLPCICVGKNEKKLF